MNPSTAQLVAFVRHFEPDFDAEEIMVTLRRHDDVESYLASQWRLSQTVCDALRVYRDVDNTVQAA